MPASDLLRETFPVGLLQCNCTILGDEVTHDAIVIDPGDEIPNLLFRLARHGLTVRQIVITHAHIDHIAGAQELKRITGAPILFHQNDLPQLAIMDEQASWLGVATPEVKPPDSDLPDGARIRIGSHQAEILHTPGHTQGSVCLYLPDQSLLLAGDTLFAGAIGRTDFPGGDTRTLIHSIHNRLGPAGPNKRRSRTRTHHVHRPGTRTKSVPANQVQSTAYIACSIQNLTANLSKLTLRIHTSF